VTAHEQPEKLGSNIVVCGGNLAGCETALYLKSIGKTSVTVVEMTDRLHADCGELVATA
jgi:thioredoxin reductase